MANTTKNRESKCIMARIMRRGEMHQKNFTLKQYRTWTAAEEAAQRWVKKMKKTLPAVVDPKGRMTKRNQSGVVGVYPRINNFKSDATEIDYCRWYARWPGCPLKGGISFSAEIFGDDEAFVMACLAREYETVDRAWIEKKMVKFWETKKCQKLLEKKQIAFVGRR